MTIKELQIKKSHLVSSVNELVLIKGKLYNNVDIESPMCEHEKTLQKEINSIFSEINQIVYQIRKLKSC